MIEAEGHEDTEERARLQRLAENPYVGGTAKRRVRQWTLARKRKFCKLVAQGASITKAAEALGLTRQSAHYQRQIDLDFAEAWAEALERQADLAEDTLAELANRTKNVGAVIFSLKNLRPGKWKDRHEVFTESHSTRINLTAQLPLEAVQALHALAQAEQDRALPPGEAPERGEGERSNGA